MRFLNKYFQFFEASQSKKIRQYIGYSVALQWYRENKEKIAKLLNCEVSELADEDTLLNQSYELVHSVINTQKNGAEGIIDTIPGFNSFTEIENNLIHDILHNIFNVKAKEFNKSLSNIEYTESEILEEIECLGIEETFMKYMNIDYPKTDFINANINQLTSYLMMAILKNDPERIAKILDGEVEPYLEIYDKKYPIKDTPYENLFRLFQNTNSDPKFKIRNSDEMKDYMIHLINVDIGIDSSGGDRAQYPDGNFFGTKSWYDLDERERYKFIDYNFDRDSDYILLDSVDSIDLSRANFDYTIIGVGDNIYAPDEEDYLKIREKLLSIINKNGFKNNIQYGINSKLKIYPNKINFEDETIYVDYTNEETNKKYSGYIQIDNIPNYLIPQLKLERIEEEEDEIEDNTLMESFSNYEDLRTIPIKPEFVDKDGFLNTEELIDFLEEYYSDLSGAELILKANDSKFILIDKRNVAYSLSNREDFEEKLNEDFNNSDDNYFDDDHDFIDMEKYEQKSFRELASILFKGDDSVSIMRRNFRTGDVVANNTKLGDSYKEETIKTKNKKHSYIDFSGEYGNSKSISKMILTENGRKLKELLDNFRGYIIKNFNRIKEEYKGNKKKFSNTDINIFKEISIEDLRLINQSPIKGELSATIYLGRTKQLSIRGSLEMKRFLKFHDYFPQLLKLNKNINNEADIDYLKNFALVKNASDYKMLKEIISELSKKEKLYNKIGEIYSDINKNIEIKFSEDNDYIKNILACIDNKDALIEGTDIKAAILAMLKAYYGNLIKDIEINIDSVSVFQTNFTIILNFD